MGILYRPLEVGLTVMCRRHLEEIFRRFRECRVGILYRPLEVGLTLMCRRHLEEIFHRFRECRVGILCRPLEVGLTVMCRRPLEEIFHRFLVRLVGILCRPLEEIFRRFLEYRVGSCRRLRPCLEVLLPKEHDQRTLLALLLMRSGTLTRNSSLH